MGVRVTRSAPYTLSTIEGKMNKYYYRGEQDFIDAQRYRLSCAMENVPGVIEINGKDYHVTSRGSLVEWPHEFDEYVSIVAQLGKIRRNKK